MSSKPWKSRKGKSTSERRTQLFAESLELRSLMASNVAGAPWVQSVRVPEPATFGTGQAITFVLKFNERVDVDPDAVIPVEVGIARREAEYVSGSGSRSIVFRLRVSDNDLDTDGIRLGEIDENTGAYDFDFGGTVSDFDGNAASDVIPRVQTRGLRVDGTGPRITGISDLMVKGNRVSVIVRLDRPVFLGSGSPWGGAIGSGRTAPVIHATIDGTPVEMKAATGVRNVHGRPALGRTLQFDYVADKNLSGSVIRLSNPLSRAIVVPDGVAIRDALGNELDYDLTRIGDLVIDGDHGPVSVGTGSKVTVTETGKVTSDFRIEKGVIYGQGDLITVVNDGIVDTILGNNAPAILIEGDRAKVTNNGELRLGGNNSPGIEIRGDDAVVENAGYIHSELVGLAGGEPGRELGNNEGISVNGQRAKVTVIGRFEGRAGNAEYVSLAGDDLTLIAAASAETFGVQSEIFSISGLKSDDPANGFTANVQGVYKTHERESEFVSVTAMGGTLDVNATFESFGRQSEGISISGGNIVSTIAGSITTHEEESEGVSLSHLSNGIGGNLKSTISAAITTSGWKSEGISLSADDSELNVSSNVTTSGNDSEGISVTGNDIDLNVTGGKIVTSGHDSEGISISGKGVGMISADLAGEIRTSGNDSEGISLTGISIVSKLTGQIITSGFESEGISITGDDIFVQIDGSIFTSGNAAPGITIDGHNITVVINGSIATTGTNSPAILVLGGSDITIDSGPNASVTAQNSVVFSNPHGVKVDGNSPFIV